MNVEGLPPVLLDAVCNSTAQCKQAFEEAEMDYIPENHSHTICLNLLIEAGADVNVKTKKRSNSIDESSEKGPL